MEDNESAVHYQTSNGRMPASSGATTGLWPFLPRTALIASVVLMTLLLILLATARTTLDWPAQESERFALLGIFILGLVPILLVLVDVVVERGAKVEYKGIVFDFSQAKLPATPGITIPANIGVQGLGVWDSGRERILDTLRSAVASDIVTIDLEDGRAWWETRLLVLLAGAVRHGHPKILVFIATEEGIRQCFVGWGVAEELLPLLLPAHSQYPLAYHAASAAARQWAMVEPVGPNIQPQLLAWGMSGVAGKRPWEAFDLNSGLPNPFLAEHLLASELEQKVEQVETPRSISVVRLNDLFGAVLRRGMIDKSWSAERQLAEFFRHDSTYIAITQNRQFKSLVSRLSVLNSVVGTLTQRR